MRAVLLILILASLGNSASAAKPKRIKPNAWFVEPARVSPFAAYWAAYNGAAKPGKQRKAAKPKKAKDAKPATQDVEPAGPKTIVNPY